MISKATTYLTDNIPPACFCLSVSDRCEVSSSPINVPSPEEQKSKVFQSETEEPSKCLENNHDLHLHISPRNGGHTAMYRRKHLIYHSIWKSVNYNRNISLIFMSSIDESFGKHISWMTNTLKYTASIYCECRAIRLKLNETKT